MVRKIASTVVAGALFFSMTLNAAAAPLATEPTSNVYTQSQERAGDPKPDAIPAVAVAFGVGVVAGVVANAVYDYLDLDQVDKDSVETQALSPVAEPLFD